MEEFTFEQGMEELEEIVRALEGGQLALSQSFDAYQRASELYTRLKAMLDEGEARMTVLTQAGEEPMAPGAQQE